MADNFKIYKDSGEIIAILIKSNFKKEGMSFFTPEDLPQQLAYIHHKKDKIIRPHVHNSQKRELFLTPETLFIKKGRIKLDLYSKNKQLLETIILEDGDIILLSSGGHGYEVLEDVEMILVKQGPYVGKEDKIYINNISD